MAGEIQVPYSATAANLYAIVRNSVGQVWQTTTSTFVSYVSANLANYVIALTEQGTASRYYTGTFPAAAAGVYGVTTYLRAGGSVAEGDTAVATGNIEWDGTAVVPLYHAPVVLAGGVTHGDATATLALQSLSIINPSGVAMTVYGSDGAMDIEATGTATAVFIQGGTNRPGLEIDGGENRSAVELYGYGTGAGLEIYSEGRGVLITAVSNHGIEIIPGGTGKHGIFSTGGTDGDGFHGVGQGVGVGFRSVPDAVGFGQTSGQAVTLLSGQSVLVYSGQLSGQRVNLLSGNQVQVWSGTQVNLFSGQLSGQNVVLSSGQTVNLFSGERAAVAGTILDLPNGVESGITLRQGQRVMLAANAGILSGAGSTNILIRDTNNTVNRIDATVDASGNRTAITLDLT